jgi:hypothetical protein
MMPNNTENHGNNQQDSPIMVVSGLPRSGTSMMMRMLEAGGYVIFTDDIRTPDENNPKGYYEFERVKKLKDGDHSWVIDSKGKVVKVVSALLVHLPHDFQYKIIFMQRDMGEILASQRKMLHRQGNPDSLSDDVLTDLYQKHLNKTTTWLASQPNMDVIYVSYNDLIQNPEDDVSRVSQFLGGILDDQAMLTVIDPTLYRERSKN